MLHAMRGLSAFGLLRAFPLPRSARGRVSRWPSRGAAREFLRGRGVFREWDDGSLNAYVNYALHRESDGQVALKCPRWLEAGFFSSYPRGLWPSIKAVTCPTAVLAGRESFPFVRRAAQRLPQLNPRFAVRWLPGGHCYMLDRPQLAARAIEEALDLWGDVRQPEPDWDTICG
jgi:pimeloyl-ACP methyl ester carboxylesterase